MSIELNIEVTVRKEKIRAQKKNHGVAYCGLDILKLLEEVQLSQDE